MANKKNIAVILLAPFVVSLLGVGAISATFSLIDNDILAINWDYEDVEAFKIDDGEQRLAATAVNDMNYPVPSTNLVWNVENVNKDEEAHAEIAEKSGYYYLNPLSEGEVTVSVSNEKGNIFRSMKGIVYKNAAIIINPKIKSSQTNIDQTLYVGEYDLDGGARPTHHNVTEEYDVNIIPSYFEDKVVMTHSDNIAVSSDYRSIEIVGSGDAYMNLEFTDPSYGLSQSVKFSIVKDGVNVYTYDDLLNCTNRSEEGEKAVLRTSFESAQNLYVYDSDGNVIGKKVDNAVEFGTFSPKDYSSNFNNEVYRFRTPGNHKYIDSWNEFAATDSKYEPIGDEVIAGLHVQKDFYGNGYTVNLHDLTYPYSSTEVESDGKTYMIPTLTDGNLYRGPLPYYVLGDPTGLPIVGAYAEDNVGMYVEGDDIIVDDINLKNCDFGNNLSNLEYTGTVLETNGNNITVKNSRLSNGRNVMRAYSSDVTIDNSMLSYSKNFLLMTGSNKSVEIDGSKRLSVNYNGQTYVTSIDKLMERDGPGDVAMSNYIIGDIDEETIAMMNVIQKAFDSFTPSDYDGHVTVKDTMFYTSGITSIAIETLFNGPFLYSAAPSTLYDLCTQMGNITEGKSILPYAPTHIAACSYPIELNVTGKTEFYDYKDAKEYDLGGLIMNNIDTIVQSIDPDRGSVTIDDIFPLKSLIYEQAGNYMYEGKINMPIAYYGGGLNNSKVTTDGLDGSGEAKEISADFFSEYLTLGKTDLNSMTGLRALVLKCVTVVTGINPFRFVLANDYLLGKEPQVSTLINRNKEGSK